MHSQLKRLIPFWLLLAMSCIEPFNPPVEQHVLDILVVEGFMNATDKTALVKLSHTLTISDLNAPAPELNATVSIQSNGGSFLLTEQDSGRYVAKDLNIDMSELYTLHIKTKSGTAYVSDSISVKATPSIDGLNFGISADGENLTILLNTHDPLGKARYYKWDYSETYEYRAGLNSGFYLVDNQPVRRRQDESIYTCWRTIPSTTISIGTSISLAEAILSNRVITSIPKASPKISARYSILVKQMVISAEEYDYLDQLRKTTQSLGGIFGTMPTSVVGNIHQENNAQATVLGYFSGAEVKEKRFFVERDQIPLSLKIPTLYTGCILEQTCDINPLPLAGPAFCVSLEQLSGTNVIINAILPVGGGNATAYTFTSLECGDCRSKGGTTKKPKFW